MDLDLVRAVLGIENPSVLAESGLYTWTDAGNPGQPVLYVGEAGNVLSRTNHERTWAAGFQELRDSGQSPWHAAGCALDVVLAAAVEPIVAMWPMDKQQRVATEIALVRLAAITVGLRQHKAAAGTGAGRGPRAAKPPVPCSTSGSLRNIRSP